ncbi:MAG: hypothetical protein AAFP24_10030 [Pseudomonadota bacterium]
MKIKTKAGFSGLAGLAIAASMATAMADNAEAETMGITQADVIEAQTEWGNGIVAISSVHAEDGDYKERAKAHITSV